MSHFTPELNESTHRFKNPNFTMSSNNESSGKEVTIIQENNACREDIEGLPKGREQEQENKSK